MPLTLSKPIIEPSVDTVTITGFSVSLNPMLLRITYQRGSSGAVLDQHKEESFTEAEINVVDPVGVLRKDIKSALYSLLVSRVGTGTVT